MTHRTRQPPLPPLAWLPTLFVLAAALLPAQVSAQSASTPPVPASTAALPAAATAPSLFESGRLLATGGVNNIEGAAGGGLATWALITGYGTKDAVGANVHGTYVRLADFDLGSGGVAVGLYDRVELSYAHQIFDTRKAGAALGIGRGFKFEQDIVGVKVRLFGNAVYDQDTLLPQVAVGLQYKKNDNHDILHAVGAKSSEGVDYYVAATKLFLAQSLLVNATLRMTKANETGILGFGGDRHNSYTPQFEGSIAYLLSRQVALGAEYRTKPRNLGFTKESDWYDVFVAWFPTKNVSLTLAYVDLGTIATFRHQRGVYASAAIGF